MHSPAGQGAGQSNNGRLINLVLSKPSRLDLQAGYFYQQPFYFILQALISCVQPFNLYQQPYNVYL